MKCKKFIYAHKFEDLPKDSDFQLVEEELPALKDGGMYWASLVVAFVS